MTTTGGSTNRHQPSLGHATVGSEELDFLEHASGRVSPRLEARLHNEHVDRLMAHHQLSPQHRTKDARLLRGIRDLHLRERTALFLGLKDRASGPAGPGGTPSQSYISSLIASYKIPRRLIPTM